MKKHELETQVAHLERQLAAARASLGGIAEYCQSEKFYTDSTVSTGDIIARVRESLSEQLDIEGEPWGLCTDIDLNREWKANGSRHIIGIDEQGFIHYTPRYLEGYEIGRYGK